MEQVRQLSIACRKCRKYAPHKIITGWSGWELEKIYVKCICGELTEVTDIGEGQIKEIEELNAKKK